MSKITGSFLILVFVIFFSSIIYIWRADAENKNLANQVTSQEEQIANLKTELISINTQLSNDMNEGEVQGVTTSIGTVSGTVILSKNIKNEAIIVCANNIHSKQETCLDFIINPNIDKYDFEFEIPQGTYEVYAVTPPSETKIYYSEVSNCSQQDCVSNIKTKRLLQVIQEETQSDIDIYL